MNLEAIKIQAAELSMARLQAEILKAQYDAETAEHQARGAKAMSDASCFGLERGKRPSSFMGPLIMFHDDIGSRWAVSYGPVGEQIVALLPSHITETGVTAYGASPEEAMLNFDKLWAGVNE
jgi:hypothetical protein